VTVVCTTPTSLSTYLSRPGCSLLTTAGLLTFILPRLDRLSFLSTQYFTSPGDGGHHKHSSRYRPPAVPQTIRFVHHSLARLLCTCFSCKTRWYRTSHPGQTPSCTPSDTPSGARRSKATGHHTYFWLLQRCNTRAPSYRPPLSADPTLLWPETPIDCRTGVCSKRQFIRDYSPHSLHSGRQRTPSRAVRPFYRIFGTFAIIQIYSTLNLSTCLLRVVLPSV